MGHVRFRLEVLRKAREAAGLTQHELALLVGVKEHTVWAWEYGRRKPTLQKVSSLAAVLGIKPFDLLEFPNEVFGGE